MKVTIRNPDDPTRVVLAVTDPPANAPAALEVVFGSDGTTLLQTDPPGHPFGDLHDADARILDVVRVASALRAGDTDAAAAERDVAAILAEWSANKQPR